MKLSVTTSIVIPSEVDTVNLFFGELILDNIPSNNTPATYHHGNLREVLVDAALALLKETQDWAFSVREVARRANVSHNAPYKHFPEKRDLLAAVAARGFDLLYEHVAAAMQGELGARDRVLASGRSAVKWGIANPVLYRLMFSAVLTTPDEGRPYIEKTAAARVREIIDNALVDALKFVRHSKDLNNREIAAASLALWSMLHGLTMLAIDDFVGPMEAVSEFADTLVDALLDGLASRSAALPANFWIAPRL